MMPTKRTFDLIVIVSLGLTIAWGIPKLWAARALAESNTGDITNDVAGAVTLA